MTAAPAQSPPRGAWAVVLAAALSASVATSGVQGIAPALPAIQDALSLTDTEVGLISAAYLLPSVLLGVPAGLLAERIGRRPAFVLFLVVYGLCGLALLFLHTWTALLAIRFVQGAAFGAILALSITLIGDVLTGPAQAKGQGRRIVAMTIGEAVFPATAGLLVALAWYAPFAMQLLAFPVAVLGWFVIGPTAPRDPTAPRSSPMRAVAGTLRDRGILALQVIAFLRFFFKFALITYYPVLAANEGGVSLAVIGFALGAAGLLGAVGAELSGRVLRVVPASTVLGISIVVTAGVFAVIALWSDPVVAVVALLAYGLADGFFGVATNVLVTRAAPPGARAAFVSMVGTVRNVGKFLAPVAVGSLVLAIPLSGAFLVVAVIGLACGAAAVPVRGLEKQLNDG